MFVDDAREYLRAFDRVGNPFEMMWNREELLNLLKVLRTNFFQWGPEGDLSVSECRTRNSSIRKSVQTSAAPALLELFIKPGNVVEITQLQPQVNHLNVRSTLISAMCCDSLERDAAY